MVTVRFLSMTGCSQITVKESQQENVINALLGVGYVILGIEH